MDESLKILLNFIDEFKKKYENSMKSQNFIIIGKNKTGKKKFIDIFLQSEISKKFRKYHKIILTENLSENTKNIELKEKNIQNLEIHDKNNSKIINLIKNGVFKINLFKLSLNEKNFFGELIENNLKNLLIDNETLIFYLFSEENLTKGKGFSLVKKFDPELERTILIKNNRNIYEEKETITENFNFIEINLKKMGEKFIKLIEKNLEIQNFLDFDMIYKNCIKILIKMHRKCFPYFYQRLNKREKMISNVLNKSYEINSKNGKNDEKNLLFNKIIEVVNELKKFGK